MPPKASTKKSSTNAVTPDRPKKKASFSFKKRMGGGKKPKPPQSIDLFKTLVKSDGDELYIGLITRPNSSTPQPSYTVPFEAAINNDETGAEFAEDWNILGFFCYSRDGTTKMKTKDGQYDWKIFVTALGPNDGGPATYGTKLAKLWTKFAKNEFQYPEKFKYGTTINDEKPLNQYLLNQDCAKILAMYYKFPKEELMSDEVLMSAFFGNAQDGEDYLESIDDEEWEELCGGEDSDNED